eukprot:gene20649-22686_t
MYPSNHEEADTRMFVHVKNLASSGHQNVTIKTVDTDVVVIATSLFREFGLVQLWIEFGTGKDKRWLPIYDYANALGENICRYVVLLYDRSSHCLTVNDARRWLFTKKSRTVEDLPPTEDALLQHARRAAFQGG